MFSSLQSWLFPPALTLLSGFTTSPYVSLPQITTAQLADKSLGVIKVESGTNHSIAPGPNRNESAWEAVYPAGSYNPNGAIRGGFGFYLQGPEFFAQGLATANEVLTSYSVMFESDWDWVEGGKLPGQFGGVDSSAYQCSGGRQTDRIDCFDLRLMWRANGLGEVYGYLPLTEDNASVLKNVPPKTIENPDYGFSIGRGAWTFQAGAWNTVAELIKLNTPGQNDGVLQLWVNGTMVIDVKGLEFRNSSESVFQGMHFQTFFGGSTAAYASPIDQRAWFTDISGAILS